MRWLTLPKQISDRALYAILLALCIPAFWINLGVMPFIGDEGIRATVALEMHLSGNYILPTLSGEPYFNKPPLYNWILLASYHLFGYFGEIPSRNTTLFFLFLFAFTAFFHIKKEFGAKAGWLAAFMLVTSGRILFWDAMLGLIDMCFSWLVYLNWMLLYSQGKRKKWLGMFVLSYLITAACFLLKGLPAVVFQVFSIPTALILFGQWKRLFYWQHFLGAAVGLLAAGSYYAVYASQVSLEKAFAILLDQSLQRTVTHYGISDTVLHLFTFPFEQVYHFLPWSLLLLFVFHPKCWKTIHSRPFVRFNFWMMAVNLPVY